MKKSAALAWLINICAILIAGTYSIMLPFLPKIAKKKNINEIFIGIIMSAFAIGHILASLLLIKYYHLLIEKHKFYFIIILAEVSTLLGFAFIESIFNKHIFVCFCILLRIIQGAGNAAITCYFFGSIRILFEIEEEDYRLKKFFLLRLSLYVGLFIGLLFSSFIWTYFKFKFICIFYGILLFLSNLISSIIFQKNKILFTSKINLNNNNFQDDNYNKKIQEINLVKVFKFKGILFTLIFYIIMGINELCIIPGYSINLIYTFKISVAESARIYSIGEISEIVSGIFFYLFIKYMNVRNTILTSFFLQLISLNLIGPCNFLKIPQKLYISIIGNFLLTLGSSVGSLNSIEIFEKILSNNINDKDIANNIANNLFSFFWGFAELIGPFLGGVFSYYFGFKNGISFISGIGFVYFIIYIFFFGYSFLNEKNDKNNENVQYENID